LLGSLPALLTHDGNWGVQPNNITSESNNGQRVGGLSVKGRATQVG